MKLGHLGLLVADQRRSQDFYASYFGFDPATATTYPDGTVIIRDAAGFDLALHAGRPDPRTAEFLHFGFHVDAPDPVRAVLARLEADGVDIVEREDDAEMVSFKCLDPDGYRVEVYWEAT